MTLKKSESKFKERVLDDLKTLNHCYFLKTQERSRRGVPDIIICLNGDFIAIELKTESGKVDKLQEYTLQRIASAGGIAIVVTPLNWLHNFNQMKIAANQTTSDNICH